jgi:hypothetical protein
MMMSVFLRNGRYAAHVAFRLRPLLGCFGEESFNSCGSGMDEHADRLIRIIFKSVDRAAGEYTQSPGNRSVQLPLIRKLTRPSTI